MQNIPPDLYSDIDSGVFCSYKTVLLIRALTVFILTDDLCSLESAITGLPIMKKPLDINTCMRYDKQIKSNQ